MEAHSQLSDWIDGHCGDLRQGAGRLEIQAIRDFGNVVLKGDSQHYHQAVRERSRKCWRCRGNRNRRYIRRSAPKTVRSRPPQRADDAGGGRISIQARDLVYFLDSLVETTVDGGTAGADAGDISIPLAALGGEEAAGVDPVVPEFVVVNRSVIRANAVAAGAGDITINGTEVVISADSLIQAHSEEGVSGEIQISSPDTDIVSQVAPLSSSFVDPSDRLLPPCVARTERTGSFMVQGREALPRPLDAPLPSNLGGAPGVDGIPPASGPTDCSVFQERS